MSTREQKMGLETDLVGERMKVRDELSFRDHLPEPTETLTVRAVHVNADGDLELLVERPDGALLETFPALLERAPRETPEAPAQDAGDAEAVPASVTWRLRRETTTEPHEWTVIVLHGGDIERPVGSVYQHVKDDGQDAYEARLKAAGEDREIHAVNGRVWRSHRAAARAVVDAAEGGGE